jgi:hypothetical protein
MLRKKSFKLKFESDESFGVRVAVLEERIEKRGVVVIQDFVRRMVQVTRTHDWLGCDSGWLPMPKDGWRESVGYG